RPRPRPRVAVPAQRRRAPGGEQLRAARHGGQGAERHADQARDGVGPDPGRAGAAGPAQAGRVATDPRAFVEALPKAELHLHLEGAVPWRLARASAREPLPERPACWADDVTFPDVADFRAAARPVIRTCPVPAEGYGRAAGAVVAGALGRNDRAA